MRREREEAAGLGVRGRRVQGECERFRGAATLSVIITLVNPHLVIRVSGGGGGVGVEHTLCRKCLQMKWGCPRTTPAASVHLGGVKHRTLRGVAAPQSHKHNHGNTSTQPCQVTQCNHTKTTVPSNTMQSHEYTSSQPHQVTHYNRVKTSHQQQGSNPTTPATPTHPHDY